MLRVHEYDTDYSLDIADFQPFILATKGLVKTSENLRKSPKIFGETSLH